MIRTERAADHAAVHALNLAAFGQPGEATLVDMLRRDPDAFVPELSLVAEEGGAVVGHLLISRARLDTGPVILSLAPMAVLPSHQRRGIGDALVREGLVRAAATEHPLVCVLGHPAYYPRFGFVPARARGIETPYESPDDAWMIFPLPRWHDGVRGTIVYPPAFGSL